MAIGESGVLSISGWSQDLTTDVVTALTVMDEGYQLEWTCMISRRASEDKAFQVKIPLSWISHRLFLAAKTLRLTADSGEETTGAI